METGFRAQLGEIDEHTPDPGEQRRQDSLNTTLRQLRRGVKSTDDIWFPEALAPIINKPGITETRRTIEGLQTERDECNAFLKRWPTREVIHRFKDAGRRHRRAEGPRAASECRDGDAALTPLGYCLEY